MTTNLIIVNNMLIYNYHSQQDFEEFLLGKVRAMPANERNGTFLVRDSVSSTGSKVS